MEIVIGFSGQRDAGRWHNALPPPFGTTAMTLLVAGLVIFLGIHSVRIFADDWRTARMAGMGPLA